MWLAHLVRSRLGFLPLPMRHAPFRPPRGSVRAREKQEIADPGIDRRQHEEVIAVLQNSRRRKLETLRGLKDTRLY